MYTKEEIRENRLEVLTFIISTIAAFIFAPQYLFSNGIDNIIAFFELTCAISIQITTAINIASKLDIL